MGVTDLLLIAIRMILPRTFRGDSMQPAAANCHLAAIGVRETLELLESCLRFAPQGSGRLDRSNVERVSLTRGWRGDWGWRNGGSLAKFCVPNRRYRRDALNLLALFDGGWERLSRATWVTYGASPSCVEQPASLPWASACRVPGQPIGGYRL